MRIRRMRVKICLVGDRGVGKTSLIRRFAASQFLDDEKGTLGAHLHPVEVEIPLDKEETAKVRVDLFDFMGEHAMRDNFRDAIFYGAHGVLAVCDLGRPETMRSLVDWVEAVSEVAGQVPVVVAFNKADLGKEIAIGATDMRGLVQKLPGAITQMTSARTGQGVEEAFNGVILKAVEGILESRKEAASREDLRYQILAMIVRKEITGRSKADLIGAFRTTDPKEIMAELDTLVDLGLIAPAEYTPENFPGTTTIPVTSHFTITAAGRDLLAGPRPKHLVVEDE
jgi:small GTP-binding protein